MGIPKTPGRLHGVVTPQKSQYKSAARQNIKSEKFEKLKFKNVVTGFWSVFGYAMFCSKTYGLMLVY
jgi:hypothetical protein